MVLQPLTSRQQEIYSYIHTQITEVGAPPTIREIGDHFGMTSTNGVRDVLAALERKGYINRSPLKSRGIELAEEVRPDVRVVPLLGRVAAGNPTEAVENVLDQLAVDQSMLPSGDVFGLQIQGESMRDAGIHEGDYIFVRSQQTARSGDMVVAVIDDEATVKWYRPRRGKIYLEPDNPAFEPIVLSRDIRIAGKVVGMMRRFE